uniref:RNA-directed RNA polymerase L n=1 Tax=Gonipterus platensis bunyan-like virus TaxID=2849065 RepID=A0A8F2Z0Y1_9VIRU|nr:RNA-dependent RNA polymerase [Gonipterus platensis bunyan-like virus]
MDQLGEEEQSSGQAHDRSNSERSIDDLWVKGPAHYMQELIEAIYHDYGMADFRPFGLSCSNARHIHDSDLIIPDFGERITISQIGERIHWTCDVPIEIADSVSISSSKREADDSEKHKIRHELVAESITQEGTDVRLDAIFTPLGDNDDRLTPDCHYIDPNRVIHLIEFATTRATSIDKLHSVLEDKRMKYEEALINRSHNLVSTLTIIVVSADHVLSNVSLPQDLVNELLVRMNLVIALENVALGKGILLTLTDQEDTLNKYAQELRLKMSLLENKESKDTSKVFISNDFISDILGEPNEEVVMTAFKTSRSAASAEVRKGSREPLKYNDYVDSLLAQKDTRCDMKPVLLFPGIIPEVTSDSQLPRPLPIGRFGPNVEIKEVWSEAFSVMKMDSENWKEEDKKKLLKEALSTNAKDIKGFEEERKKKRKNYHRVNLRNVMCSKIKRYLAKDGIGAKKYKHDPVMKERRKQQKKPFNYNTDISDISEFLNSKQLFEKSKTKDPEYMDKGVKLIKLAADLAGNSSTGTDILEQWTTTRLFRLLDFYSDIAFELAIACKQHTKVNEMVVKKLRYWNCYLLISLTKSRSHIFYSLLFPKTQDLERFDSSVFRPLVTTAHALITDFCSVRVDKIENIASCSASLLTFSAFWSWFYNLKDNSPESFMNNKSASNMLLMTILVRMEDKAQTEEIITLTRYMYMELFKSNLSITRPNPFKMLKKFPTQIRSRFSLFLIKQIISNFNSMMRNPPVKTQSEFTGKLPEGEDSLPGDEWTGLVNCFNGSPIYNATKAVNIFYIGYAKNKNEVAQGNVEFKLIEKIIEEEMKLDMSELDRSMGGVPGDERPKTKQFNRDCIMMGCKMMEKRLKSKFGPDYKTVLEKEILTNLSKQLTHEIATLKASSAYEHQKACPTVSSDNNEEIHRIKVIEAVSAHLNELTINPMSHLEKLIEKIEGSHGGVIADLFKKSQHGGLREIYVLPIEDRVVQLFIETISRTLCSKFEEETLTHPENKLKLLDKHIVRASRFAKLKSMSYTDFCNSSDKTRWNQNFVMPAMSIPLFRLTTPLFHNAIQRILNLWANKLIKIPPSVCSLLLSKTKLDSEAYMDLLGKFWNPGKSGKGRQYIQKRCASFVNLTTGMMQGILHYTSSLLHISYLTVGKYYTLKTMKTLYPTWTVMMTQVCSSDDSATILSLFTSVEPENLKRKELVAVLDAEIILHTLTKFCEYFCMRESDKSTIALNDYVEFNSDFLFKNTIAKPLIKVVAASTNLTESESFVTRFHTMYNLISDLYQSGMPSYYTSFVQIGQAWLHYKSMGLSTNGLFSKFYELIMQMPNSVMGFFYLDSELICGLMGFSFSEYLAYDSCENLSKSLSVLNLEELEASPDGGMVKSLTIKHGDLRKWHLMMDRIEAGRIRIREKDMSVKKDKVTGEIIRNEETIRRRHELMEGNPELLFRVPKTLEELKVKLLQKASMPGVGKSLSKGNPFIQSLALSMYALNTHCFTKSSISSELIGGVMKVMKKTEKTNLLLELTNMLKSCESGVTDLELIKKMTKLKFPLLERYEEVSKLLSHYKDRYLIEVPRMRQRKNKVVIQPKYMSLPLTLLQVVGSIWFGFNVKVSHRVVQRCWDVYKGQFPWLSDTFRETLLQSPFQTSIELHSFVSSISSKTRNIMMCGPGIYSNLFSGQIIQLIRKYYRNGFLVTTGEDAPVKLERLDSAMTELSLALQIPLPRVRANFVRNVINYRVGPIPDTANLKRLSKRELSVYLIAGFMRGELTPNEIFTILRQTRTGIFIMYPRPQKEIEENGQRKWVGKGEALVLTDGMLFKVYMTDQTCDSITVHDLSEARKNPGLLQEVLRRLNLKQPPGSSFKLRVVARFTGTRFTAPSGRGIPIMQDDTLFMPYTEQEKLEFKIHEGKCGLYTISRGCLESVILFTTQTKDITFTTQGHSKARFWESWATVSPASWEEAYKMLKTVSKLKQSSSITKGQVGQVKNWMKETIISRLKFRNIGYTNEDFSASIIGSIEDYDAEFEMDDMNWLEEELEGAMDSDIQDIASAFEENAAETMRTTQIDRSLQDGANLEVIQLISDMEMNLFDLQDSPIAMMMHNYSEPEPTYGRSVMSQKQFTYLFMHPIWDDFIDHVMQSDVKFFSKLVQGVASISDPDLSRLLMDLMGIVYRGTELSLTERFKQRGQSIEQLIDDFAFDSDDE